MPFTKGHTINLGRKYSPEHCRKISEAHKGTKKPWSTGQSGRGRIVGAETRRKMSEARLGKKLGPMSVQSRINISVAHLGQRAWNKGLTAETDERVRKYTEKLKGENSPHWKGGVTSLYKQIRKSPEYKRWRTAVFKRDNYTCQHCREVGGRLNADHIKPFADYPELRFELSNGQTLCESCHRKTETWGFSLVHSRKETL